MNLKEMGHGNVDWIQLPLDGVRQKQWISWLYEPFLAFQEHFSLAEWLYRVMWVSL